MAKKNILPPFSEDLIIERLRFENPWWVSGATDDEYRQFKHRRYFALFQPLVEETEIRRSVVLMGPRRVGKTVMLFHSIQWLIEGGVSPLQILYANIENPVYNNIPLERLFQLARKATGRTDAKGIQDVQEMNSLFTTLAYHSGNEISLENLSKASHVEKHMLKKYLEYLEAAFLIRTIHRVDDNAKLFQRANFFKIYLTNPSLRSALFAPLQVTDDHMGNMVETAIFSQWMHRDWFTPWYARWKDGEVDMIGIDDKKLKPVWALEIKWSNRFFEAPGELKSLIQFCQKNNLRSAMVTSIDREGTLVIQDITLHFVPAAVYAYVVAYNTLEHKRIK